MDFRRDPLGFVRWAFPWGDSDGPPANSTGPEPWQRDVLKEIGRKLEAGESPVRVASIESRRRQVGLDRLADAMGRAVLQRRLRPEKTMCMSSMPGMPPMPPALPSSPTMPVAPAQADPAVKAAREDARRRAAGLQGCRSTIVTSELGLSGAAAPLTTALKTLLGQ